MATTRKKPASTAVKDTVSTVPEKNMGEPTAETKEKKEYKMTEGILCKSITAGELILVGRKTGSQYRWANYGDILEVEYQDLYSLKVTRSHFIYDPLILIEDEELLEQWPDVAKVYSKIGVESINELLDLPVNSFENALRNAPVGIKNSIKATLAAKIMDGSFDSITKIKAADRALGTELIHYID